MLRKKTLRKKKFLQPRETNWEAMAADPEQKINELEKKKNFRNEIGLKGFNEYVKGKNNSQLCTPKAERRYGKEGERKVPLELRQV